MDPHCAGGHLQKQAKSKVHFSISTTFATLIQAEYMKEDFQAETIIFYFESIGSPRAELSPCEYSNMLEHQ